jgi:1-acyl-sn-glycerol-3-phosphate acyltransferase
MQSLLLAPLGSAAGVAAASAVVGYAALWRQLLPNAVNKIIFNAATLCSVVTASAICRVISLLATIKLMPRGFSENLSRCVTSFVLKVGSWFSPHVHVVEVKGSLPWKSIPSQSALALNHTSFMDTILYLWRVPYPFIWGSKTLYKYTLEKLWFFGQIIRSCGQFPVFFKNSEEFTVEKDRQAAVAEKLNLFLTGGGGLSFFPEGAVNKTPEKLADFRHGSFTTIIQHRLPVYYIVTWGCQDVWPPSGAGGNAATILLKAGQLSVDFSDSTLTAKDLATRLHEKMQEELDALRGMAGSRRIAGR